MVKTHEYCTFYTIIVKVNRFEATKDDEEIITILLWTNIFIQRIK